jgi:hypothetical protein
MRLFINNQIREATPQEVATVLKLPIFEQPVSGWQGWGVGKGFSYLGNTSFGKYIDTIIHPENLPTNFKKMVKNIMQGAKPKSENFGFCLSTFPLCKKTGKVRRLKDKFLTFTHLIQLDIDLKNEPNYTEALLQDVQQGLFETDLGKYILLCARSIGRKGLYVFIQTDTSDTEVLKLTLEKIYAHIQNYFHFQADNVLDTSVSDIINRLRFYSPDMDIIINPEVETLDTSPIRKALEKQQQTKVVKLVNKSIPKLTVGNEYLQLSAIQRYFHKHMSRYDKAIYQSGFHEAFLRFANACLFAGVDTDTLIEYTTYTYENLYNQEKRMKYLPELIRNITCAEANVRKQSK